MLTPKNEHRVKTAGDEAESAFANLEERINKSTAMANDTLKQLETGGSQIAHQHDKIQKALEEMSQRMEDTRTGTARAPSNTSARGARGQSGRLISLKEISVDRLPGDVTRADVSNWAEDLYVHLKGVDGWTRISARFKPVCADKLSLTGDSFLECADKAHDKSRALNNLEVDLGAKD